MKNFVGYAVLSIFLLMAVTFCICFFVIGIQRLVKRGKTMKKLYMFLYVFGLVVDALMTAAIIYIMAGMVFTDPFIAH